MSRCECMACGLKFTGESSFHKHRLGEYNQHARRCLTIPEMQKRGYRLTREKFWTISPEWTENPIFQRSVQAKDRDAS